MIKSDGFSIEFPIVSWSNSSKFVRFSASFDSKTLTFFRFKYFVVIVFPCSRVKISLRIDSRYLEVAKKSLERIKRDLFEPAHFGYEKLPGAYTNFRTQLTCTGIVTLCMGDTPSRMSPWCVSLGQKRYRLKPSLWPFSIGWIFFWCHQPIFVMHSGDIYFHLSAPRDAPEPPLKSIFQ